MQPAAIPADEPERLAALRALGIGLSAWIGFGTAWQLMQRLLAYYGVLALWTLGCCLVLSLLPLAVPGMTLGLGYIFFFNHPDNPLNGLYGGMTILVLCTLTHFYSVPHLNLVTAFKQ